MQAEMDWQLKPCKHEPLKYDGGYSRWWELARDKAVILAPCRKCGIAFSAVYKVADGVINLRSGYIGVFAGEPKGWPDYDGEFGEAYDRR